MAYIAASDGVQLHVKDTGQGRPVVLIHGWPLSGDMFEFQTLALSMRANRMAVRNRAGEAKRRSQGVHRLRAGQPALRSGHSKGAHLRDLSIKCGIASGRRVPRHIRVHSAALKTAPD